MNIRNSIVGYIKEANVQLETATQEIASGDKAKLTPLEFGRKLVLGGDIGAYKNINEGLTVSKAENQVADKVISEMKDVVTSFKSKMIVANTATTSNNDRDIIAQELRHYKDSLVDMANTEVAGHSIFTGADKSIQPFSYETDVDGHYTNITYNGSAKNSQQEIGKGIYKDQGLTGLELFDGLVDSSGQQIINHKGEALYDNTVVSNKDGSETITLNKGDIIPSGLMYDNTQKPLQPKILYELGQAIQAIDNNETSANANGRSIGSALDKVSDEVFIKLNSQHANLGNRNAIFERAFEQNEYKLHNLDKLLQETEGIDITDASIKLQQLQLIFEAMFSTLRDVNQIEQKLIEYT